MKLQTRSFVARKPETIDITAFFKKFCIATRTNKNLELRFEVFIFYHFKSIHKNTVHTANKPWYALRLFSLGSQSSLTQPLIILPVLLR